MSLHVTCVLTPHCSRGFIQQALYIKIKWTIKTFSHIILRFYVQRWFVNPDISLIRTKSVGTDFHVRTNWRFSNPENSLIRKFRPGTKLMYPDKRFITVNTINVCAVIYLPFHVTSAKQSTIKGSICSVSVCLSICLSFSQFDKTWNWQK